MKYNYLIKESLRGFNSAKLSTLASVSTIALSLIIIGIYFFISVNSSSYTRKIKDKVELEIFLQDGYSINELDSLKENLKRIGGIKQIAFVSKEEAIKIFEKEYGKDMLEIIEGNPLPASFKVALYDEYKTIEKVEKLKKQISELGFVSDVIYPKKNLEVVDKNFSSLLSLNLIILIVITISSVFLVSNTIRLVIASKEKLIYTMKLLGATKKFIRSPFLIEGLIQGFAGGVIAAVFLYLLMEFVSGKLGEVNVYVEIGKSFYILIIIALGIILGISGSAISIRRYLKFEN
ncbi:MAG: FtsX-like permease family protein [Bacteroidetes bacterium]|nr:FtsX-like permease family protein [Bacteroidota bacterium]